jgi:hypothetical protein
MPYLRFREKLPPDPGVYTRHSVKIYLRFRENLHQILKGPVPSLDVPERGTI